MKSKSPFPMKSLSLGLSVLGLLAALNSHARGGGTTSHGGDAVVCFKNGMADVVAKRAAQYRRQGIRRDALQADGIAAISGPVELLDLYEARHALSMDGSKPVSLTTVPKDLNEAWKVMAARIQNTHSLLWAGTIAPAMREIPLANWNLSANGVPEIDDSNEKIHLPSHCLLIQVAVQSRVGGKTTIHVDNRLFSRMPALDRVALVSHEWIYNTAVIWGDLDSTRTRAINAILYRKDFGPSRARSVNEALFPYANWIMRSSSDSKVTRAVSVTCSRENACFYSLPYGARYDSSQREWKLASDSRDGEYYALNTVSDGLFHQVVPGRAYVRSCYPTGHSYAGIPLKRFLVNVESSDIPYPRPGFSSIGHPFDGYKQHFGYAQVDLARTDAFEALQPIEGRVFADFDTRENPALKGFIIHASTLPASTQFSLISAEFLLAFANPNADLLGFNAWNARYVLDGEEITCPGRSRGLLENGKWTVDCR